MHWRLTFLLLLSLLVGIVGASGQSSAEWAMKPNPDSIREYVKQNPDQQLSRLIERYEDKPTLANQKAVEQWLEVRESFARVLAKKDDTAVAKSIKENPLYQDRGEAQNSNWIGQALSRLKFEWPTPKGPEGRLPGGGIGNWLTPLMWVILAGLVAFLGYHVVKRINLQKRIRRRAEGLLEDEEPERTVDEWLEMANQLAAEGRHREAVRCLYIACLLRFDEFRIARFDRRQTNWEHLARIEANPEYPNDINFRIITQRFDRIWYGYQIKGASDFAEFQTAYQQVLDRVRVKA